PSRREGIATLAAHRAVQAHIGIHRVSTRAMSLRSHAEALMPGLLAQGAHGGDDAGAAVRVHSGGAENGDGEAVDGPSVSSGSQEPAPAAGSAGRTGRLAALWGGPGQWAPSTRAAIQVAVATSVATI